MKVYIAFMLSIYVSTMPAYAYAGFFSNLVTKPVFGELSAEVVAPEVEKEVHNSQTVPLLESSINPDQMSLKDSLPSNVIADEDVISNVGPLATMDLGKYASSEKISTYVVKSGDTLDGIANRLKVSKSTILSSNADLKSTDLLKVGQTLTILPIEGVSHKVAKGDTLASIAKKYTAEQADIIEYNSLDKTATLKVGESIVIPGGKLPVPEKVAVKKEEPKKVAIIEAPKVVAPVTPSVEVKAELKAPAPVEKGQVGTISGGYIWPFPTGMGRVSQGLHGDQGYDFAAPKGTPILAIQSGTVLIADTAGYNGGYGLYVVVNFDDGGQAIFGHMSKVAAVAGQKVNRGDVIGYVGSTGKSTGNHVHIGYRGGKPSPYKGLKVNSTGLPTDHD